MLDIECHRARVALLSSRCAMNIYQMFNRKNDASFKSELSYRRKNFYKTPVSFLILLPLLIATYFLLKLTIEGIERNPGHHTMGDMELKR